MLSMAKFSVLFSVNFHLPLKPSKDRLYKKKSSLETSDCSVFHSRGQVWDTFASSQRETLMFVEGLLGKGGRTVRMQWKEESADKLVGKVSDRSVCPWGFGGGGEVWYGVKMWRKWRRKGWSLCFYLSNVYCLLCTFESKKFPSVFLHSYSLWSWCAKL